MTNRPPHDDQCVKAAAMWLSEERCPSPQVISDLQNRFQLSALQAPQAFAMAKTFQTLRRAHG